jgi:hypothetical protein
MLTVASLAWAVDVNGPYQNGQTSIEYVVNQDGSVSLYAINCRDNPTDAGGFYLYNTVPSGQAFWSSNQFQDLDGFRLTDGPPVLLSRNNASVDQTFYSVSAITSDNHVYLARRNDVSHWMSVNHSDLTTDAPKVVTSSWSFPENQWIGLNTRLNPNLASPTIRTVNGWQDALQFTPIPQPWADTNPRIYSAAISDFAIVSRAVACLCAPAPNDNMGQEYSRVERQVVCRTVTDHSDLNGLYYTDDQGETWHPTEGLFLRDVTNVQIAVTKPLNPVGEDNLIYVLYSDHIGQVSLAWARWVMNTFIWHGPILQGEFPATDPAWGAESHNMQIMDLAATTGPEGTVTLAVATNHSFYFGTHNEEDDDIAFEERNGRAPDVIGVPSLWDVAVSPRYPATEFAIAGPSGCYETFDAGVHWSPLYNGGMLRVPVAGGARQSATTLVATYVELESKQHHWHFGTDFDANEVFVQLGPRQGGEVPNGRLTEMRHIGFGATDWRPRMAYSSADARFYVAYPDVQCSSIGMVAVSDDDGATWNRGAWTNWTFTPPNYQHLWTAKPQAIVPDPIRPLRAYLTFHNPALNGLQWAPPYAYTIDGGISWTVPDNRGLNPEWMGDDPGYVVTSGQTATHENILWLAGGPGDPGGPSDNRLMYSSDDGNTWLGGLELPLTWQQVNSITCQATHAEEVSVSAPEGIACYFQNTGAWTTTLTPEQGQVEQIVADPDISRLLWVSTIAWDNIHHLYLVLKPLPNVPAVWRHLTEWNGEQPDWTDLGLERAPDMTRRLFWSRTNLPDGIGGNLSFGAPLRFFEYEVMPATVALSQTVTKPIVYMLSNVDVAAGATLTFAPGVTVYAAPRCSLRVAGSLIAGSGCQFNALDSTDISTRWGGIHVTGAASIDTCAITGATAGVTMIKAGAVRISDCTIRENGIGVYIYDNPTGAPQNITSCSIHDNTQEGISLLASKKLTLTGNQIDYNGHDGVLAVNSSFTMNENSVSRNGSSVNYYGLNCSGSSPILFCNQFENNAGGEIGTSKQSYPVLWAADGSAGANSFLNDNTTLILMWDSNPVIAGGKNNFRLGTGGYFMADNSGKPSKHDISVNYWNPSMDISKLWPHDVTLWTWLPTSPEDPCGSAKEGGSGAASVLYEQGFNAEMAGNIEGAQASYSSLVTQYPESTITVAAIARLFDSQRQADSAYSGLQTSLLNLASANPEDTAFVETAQALARRLYVEDQQYDPSYSTYEQIMANPPSQVDSFYAALDYTITALRQGLDSTGGNLDCAGPVATASDVNNLVRQLSSTLPTPPTTHHEGYIATPNEFHLEPNFPNPFNATTTLRYYLPQAARVRLDIFNIAGQKVASLVDANQASGPYSVSWNGEALASGMYIYRLEADGHTLTHKMLLLK